MNELLYQIWLMNLKGISPTTAMALREAYGSFTALYEANFSLLMSDNNLNNSMRESLLNKNLDTARGIMETCEKQDIKIISYYDKAYPERLKQIVNPPLLLYVTGTLPDIDNSMTVAVVGARKPSVYGSTVATDLAYSLAQKGIIIISGMARGIDSLSHRSALRAEEKTVAVLGCGVDVVYPPENGELKKLIESNGAVISEYPPGTPPLPAHFPLRNRIISGLSCATVIVEGRATSGSNITAHLALEQGREVYAVPGNIDNPLSMGPHQAIRDGATLITSAEDIIVALTEYYPELMTKTVLSEKNVEVQQNKKYKNLLPEQKAVAKALSNTKMTHIDEICFKTKLDAGIVSQSLTMLEIQGVAKQLPGKNYILC